MSTIASAPTVAPDRFAAFARTYHAVSRVFLDEGVMSEIAGFLGASHNLDATCRAIKEVNEKVGEYTLSTAASYRLFTEARHSVPLFTAASFRPRDPISQCRVSLKINWNILNYETAAFASLRVVSLHLKNELARPELIPFFPQLEALNIAQADTLGGIDFVRSLPKLRELRLARAGNIDLSALAFCPQLRVVKLPDSKVTEQQLLQLFTNNRNIEVLHIPGVDTPDLLFASVAPRLRELNIQRRPTYPIVPLYGLTSLKTLEVSKSNVRAKNLKKISALELLIVHASPLPVVNGMYYISPKKEIRDIDGALPGVTVRAIFDVVV